VIRLGLRLTLAGGRDAIGRLVLIVVAVTIGVALLLSTVAGLNAVRSQNDRYAWLETGYAGSNAPASAAGGLWWRLRADYFHGAVIGRIDVAAAGPVAAVPPGIPALPGPGQYYASPALARLLRDTPAAQLSDRYPGSQTGTIGSAALPSPDSLIIVVGHTAAELSQQPDVHRVSRISSTVPGDCSGDCAFGVGTNSNGLILILSVVAAALLFPVLILVGGATRLSAARREQRFAAIRLVGATPGQVAQLAIVESTAATVIGLAGGFGLFFAIRPAVARIPFTGERFFSADLSVNLADIVLVAAGLPIAAAVAAWLALRRVTLSPLGVSRRVAPKPPTPWRLLPLLAGVAELGYFAYVQDIGARSHTNTTVEALVFLAGVLLVMTGLVTAGPWLTMLASRLVVRRANRPATLIAARRLADNPQAGFRAISGLVLAVFVGTCATGIITTIVAASGGQVRVDGRVDRTLVDSFGPPDRAHPVTLSAATTARLTSIPGVGGVAVIHSRQVTVQARGSAATRSTAPHSAAPHSTAPDSTAPRSTAPGPAAPGSFQATEDLVSCADLVRVPALGRCAPGASVVSILLDYGFSFTDHRVPSHTTRPSANVTSTELPGLPIDSIVVGIAGSTAAAEQAAVEQARTVLDLAYPSAFAPQTIGELRASDARLLNDYRRLAEVVLLTSLPIAGSSLAVSIAGGLIERKRPFSLLRLTGTPLRTLRHIIGLEAAAPMLITAVVSIGAGLLAAHLFLRAQLGETLQPPGPEYYLVMLGGLLAALAVLASTLPLLNRLTGPEIARNE
jgi:hypothetical protein